MRTRIALATAVCLAAASLALPPAEAQSGGGGGGTLTALTDGLIALYRFSGSAVDATANHNDGTVFGPILATDRAGTSDSAYHFDGFDDYIEVPDSDTLDVNHFTLAAWIYVETYPPPGGGPEQAIIWKQTPSGSEVSYAILLNNQIGVPIVRFLRNPGPHPYWDFHDLLDSTPASPVRLRTWTFVAATFDGVEMKTFIDGELVGQRPSTGSTYVSRAQVRIGQMSASFPRPFHGLIDEVRIYNRALPQDEIRLIAAAGFLELSKDEVPGCLGARGTVTLGAPAAAGGLTVPLHTDNPNVVLPASLSIKAGALRKSFPIETSAVAATETATIDASLPEGVSSAVLTLTPMGLKSVSLTPNPVVGGTTVAGTVTLPCPAGPEDIEVTFTSTKPYIAEPTVESVLVPVGTQDMPFEVRTTPVFAPVALSVKATANGVTKARKLALEPVP